MADVSLKHIKKVYPNTANKLAAFVEFEPILIFLCSDFELVNTIRHFGHPFRISVVPSISVYLAKHVVALFVDSRSWGWRKFGHSCTYCIDGDSIT